MKAQLCKYRVRENAVKVNPPGYTPVPKTVRGGWRTGIAFLKEFDVRDVDFILDITGRKVAGRDLYDYRLESGPLAYIDSNYGDKQ